MNTKARAYCFTAFQDDPPTWDDTFTYLVYQREVCPDTQREHWQGYVEFKSPKTISAAQKALDCPNCHCEKRKGKPSEAAEYCKKQESRKEYTLPFEQGEINDDPNPGQRTDLLTLKRMIDDGTSEKELWEQEFAHMSHNYKAMRSYMDLSQRVKARTWMTKGIWIWGPTGVGKSHKVFEDYDPETHFVYEVSDKGWWDGYEGQKIVIINDFRGEIKYGELLQLIDKWPKRVPRRCRETCPFLAEEVRITSSMPPEAVYSGVAEKESIDQLLRRLCVTQMGAVARVFNARST